MFTISPQLSYFIFSQPLCKVYVISLISLSWITTLSWWRGLHNSMKLWAMPCRAIQDRWVIVKSSDKTWSSGGGNGKPPQYICHENPTNYIKREKDVTLKDEPQYGLEGVQYASSEEQRTTTNSSRKNEAAGSKWKQNSVSDVSGDESKTQCCKEQYCIGTWC